MITATFQNEEEVQRILFLLHRDLARVVGNQILAQEKLDDHQSGVRRLSGRMREKAQQTVETTPKQEEVIRNAQGALQDALKRFQAERGQR